MCLALFEAIHPGFELACEVIKLPEVGVDASEVVFDFAEPSVHFASKI
jgi:hypothetical protein